MTVTLPRIVIDTGDVQTSAIIGNIISNALSALNIKHTAGFPEMDEQELHEGLDLIEELQDSIAAADIPADIDITVRELLTEADTLKYPRLDWQWEAYQGDTVLGYTDWVNHQKEAAAHDRTA